MISRTTREFSYTSDIWPIVEEWAVAHDFKVVEQDARSRVYQKGNRLIMAPICLALSQENGNVTLEAWIKADMYLVMALMTGKPPEAGIQSGGPDGLGPPSTRAQSGEPAACQFGSGTD